MRVVHLEKITNMMKKKKRKGEVKISVGSSGVVMFSNSKIVTTSSISRVMIGR